MWIILARIKWNKVSQEQRFDILELDNILVIGLN